MGKVIFYIAVLTIGLAVFAGCNQKNKNTQEPVVTTEQKAPDAHNSRNSLDYEGTYAGILPCADCEGIETEITLDKDTYTKIVIYLGKSETKTVETSGTYSWNETGSIITLEDEDKPNQYQVGENRLFHLDMDGNRITGELAGNYVLIKK